MGRYSKTTATLAVLVLLGLTACGGSSDDTSTESAATDDASALSADAGSNARSGDGEGRPEPPAAVDDPVGDDIADEAADAAAPSAAGQATGGSNAPSAPLDLDGLGRAIAVEAGVVIGTANIRQAVDDTLVVVQRNNGSVFTADVNIGEVRDDGAIDGEGRIVVKVPPIDLDPLIADLDGTAGVLIGRTQNSEDVTEQLIDLDIRIRVEQSTIAGFETLLAQATEFSEIVTIQQVITEHTITLEQLLASQRNVDQRVELSTLTIDLSYVAPVVVVDEPLDGDDGIVDAFRTGWDAFVGVLFAVGLVVAVAAPFLAVLLVVGALVLLVGRGRRARVGDGSTRPHTTSDRLSEETRVDALVVPSGSVRPEPDRAAPSPSE